MADIQSASRDGLIVCACGAKEYTARDAIDAGLFRGELESIWEEFLCNVEAEKRAKQLQLELDLDAVEEMAELFRYDHDLITAEETERWLEQRGLNLEDFTDHFTRRYWRSVIENLSPPDTEIVSAPTELRELFTTELIFTGELGVLIRELMWRLAALRANGERQPDEIDAVRQQFIDRFKLKPSKIKKWLDQIGREEEWLEQAIAMEVAYRRMKELVLSSDARKRQLTRLRMPLTRFEAEVIELESLDAAREALLCIRQDGLPMEEVAAEARYPYRRINFRYEDVPTELQQKFWSVAAGDLLEPLRRGEGFELYRITSKAEPDLTDPIVQERIEKRLLEQHFSHLVRDHVEPRLQAATASE